MKKLVLLFTILFTSQLLLGQSDDNSLFKTKIDALPEFSFKAPKGLALNNNELSLEDKYPLSKPLSKQFKLKENFPKPIYKPYDANKMPLYIPNLEMQFYLKVFEQEDKAG